MHHAVAEERAVGEPGERIVEGLVRELIEQRLPLAHVARVEHDAAHRLVVEHVARDRLDLDVLAVGATQPPFRQRRHAGQLRRHLDEVADAARLSSGCASAESATPTSESGL